MSTLTPFRSDEFELSITEHETDGFRVLAPGLARALGFRDAYRLMESIPDAEKGYTLSCTPGGDQRVGYLTEAGFYRALGQRQAARITDDAIRAQVERFQTWVYGTVLPQIRKTGSYGAPIALPGPKELARMVIEAEEAREIAEAKVAELEPSAKAWGHMVDAAGTYSIGDAAKILANAGISIGRQRLFERFAEWKWIYRAGGRDREGWRVYQDQIETGRLVEKANRPFLNARTGDYENAAPTIRVTAKGLDAAYRRLTGGKGALLAAVTA